jgi:hypothetical protein
MDPLARRRLGLTQVEVTQSAHRRSAFGAVALAEKLVRRLYGRR